MASRFSTPSERALANNIFVIDCNVINLDMERSVNLMLQNTNHILYPLIKFKCLHGDLDQKKGDLCLYPKRSVSNLTFIPKPVSVQEVLRPLIIKNNTVVHLITIKGFSITSTYSTSIDMLTKLIIWTTMDNIDGSMFDIRRKYWFNPSIMEVKRLTDLPMYWSVQEKNILSLPNLPVASTLAWFAGFYESVMPNSWA